MLIRITFWNIYNLSQYHNVFENKCKYRYFKYLFKHNHSLWDVYKISPEDFVFLTDVFIFEFLHCKHCIKKGTLKLRLVCR